MFALQVIYDSYTPAVEAQLTRDLIALKNAKPRETLAVICAGSDPEALLEAFNIDRYPQGATQLTVVYKVGEQWPEHPDERDTEVVMRDLYQPEDFVTVNPNPTVGYYMPPQGRPIPQQVNLSKRGPQGKGCIDPALLNIWGGPPGFGGIM